MSERESASYQRKEVIGNCVLYLGDCREIMPMLDRVDAIVTDPVWPNALSMLAGADRPKELFAEAAAHFAALADRLAVQLGCNSDPRFLDAVPSTIPFFRTCWLEYAAPHYLGRLLFTGDIGYLFGLPPASKRGARVIPGKKISVARYGTEVTKEMHPCVRRLEHVEWLVHWWSDGAVLDPFMGSGTTGVACAKMGRSFIGIEIDESYFTIACHRIREAYSQSDMFVEQA